MWTVERLLSLLPGSRCDASFGCASAYSFDFSVCMARVTAFRPRQHWIVSRPRPASKACLLVVGEGLLNFGAGIHDERSVLYDRFADRSSLEKQHFALLATALKRDLRVRLKFDHRTHTNLMVRDGKRVTAEEVQG